MITPEAENKLEQVSKKYIPLLDKAIDEGYAQLARNRNKRVFRALDKIKIEMNCDWHIGEKKDENNSLR